MTDLQLQPIYILDTLRLRLRVPSPADLPIRKERCLSDHSKFLSSYNDPEACLRILVMELHNWVEHRFGALAIEDKTTGVDLGLIHLYQAPKYKGGVPVWFQGYHISEAVEGQGIGYEACGAACEWYFDNCDVPELYCHLRPDNLRSKALAERLGFKRLGVSDADFDIPHDLWSYPRSKDCLTSAPAGQI